VDRQPGGGRVSAPETAPGGLTAEELTLLGGEAGTALAGAILARVRPEGSHGLRLTFRSARGRLDLLVDPDPRLPRLHLAWAARRGATRSAFGDLVRSRLLALRLQRIEVPPGDRSARVVFRAREASGEWRLVAELYGPRALALLLDPEGRIVGLSREVVSRKRRLAPGEPYVALPAAPPRDGPPPRFAPGPDLAASRAADRLLSEAGARAVVEERRRALLQALGARAAREEGKLRNLEEDFRRTEGLETARQDGELLKASLHLLRRGMTEVSVTDWFQPGAPPRTIPLDPTRDPQQNLEALFRRYRKLRSGRDKVAALREASREAVTKLRALEAEVAGAPGLDELEAAARLLPALRIADPALPREPRPRRSAAGDEPARAFHRFVSRDGLPILVGKGARDNDRLTFRQAGPHDLWLHVRGRPGAHVVVPLARGQPPPQESLLDAATLAVHFSTARGAEKAEVEYTLRKHVLKPSRGPAGLVLLRESRTMLLRREEDRLARLLGTPGGATL
jgi:predicted ribosome quality control (RQC) complex YloA/Tae2 family protein